MQETGSTFRVNPVDEIDEATFVALYGEVEVMQLPSGKKLTLATVMEREAEACPVDESERADPDARLAKLARWVFNHGQLAPEHHYLIPNPEAEA